MIRVDQILNVLIRRFKFHKRKSYISIDRFAEYSSSDFAIRRHLAEYAAIFRQDEMIDQNMLFEISLFYLKRTWLVYNV